MLENRLFGAAFLCVTTTNTADSEFGTPICEQVHPASARRLALRPLRQVPRVAVLLELTRDMICDGEICDGEAIFLQSWFQPTHDLAGADQREGNSIRKRIPAGHKKHPKQSARLGMTQSVAPARLLVGRGVGG